MERNVKYVQLVLENCEVIDINIKDINYMMVDGIYEFNIIGCSKKVEKRRYCKEVELIINKRADKDYEVRWDESLKVFARLIKFPDIVGITYLDSNKESIESILVPWFDYDDEDNNYQTGEIDSDGNLVIYIKEGR